MAAVQRVSVIASDAVLIFGILFATRQALENLPHIPW